MKNTESWKQVDFAYCSSDAPCPVPFKLLGCFKDSQQPTRTLPELLFTDKDKQSKVYSGIPIGWGNWNSYLEDLVCRCSKKAKEKKYTHFGIQYYGKRKANNLWNRYSSRLPNNFYTYC